MNINCNSLKEYIEMTSPCLMSNNEGWRSRYTCHPDNEGEIFDSTVYIHNNVRVVVEIIPKDMVVSYCMKYLKRIRSKRDSSII